MRIAGLVALGALIVVVPEADSAAPAGCTQIMQQINQAAATVSRNAGEYWARRKNFVESKFGAGRVAPDASKRADQSYSEARPVQAAFPSNWQRLASLLDTAQSQKCSSSVNLLAIRESTFKLARAVRIDRFPIKEQSQAQPSIEKPKLMPSN